ncbi:MAG: glycosyltransferase family 39 protein, partial [Chloroflexi bacterium]|nr:glycosyltransferase family 39 protein [Chloroflexota bacterium]
MTLLRRALSRSIVWHAAILAAYVLLTLALTWPLVLRINTHVPGRNVDEYAFLWNIWWFKYAIFDLGASPLHTNYTFYPLGVNLALYTLGIFNDVVSLPLQSFLSIPTISNLIIILSFALSGYGTFLLARYLLRDDSSDPSLRGDGGMITLAAFIGGMVYAFASCRFVYASLGHYNVVSSEWLPFYVLFLIKTLRRGRWRDALLAGVFALLCLLCENTFGVFLALLTLAVLLFEWRRLNVRKVVQLGAGALVAFVGYLPLLVPILSEMTRAQGYNLKGWGGAEWLAADALGLFVPTALHPFWGGTAQVMDLQFKDTHTVFLGYVLPLLALVGAIVYRRRLKLWITVAVASVLLALGPLLTVGGQQVFDLDGLEVTVPLPFILLHYIPIVNANRTPNRFSLTLMMALGVLVAFAVFWLVKRISSSTSSLRVAHHAVRYALPL